MSFGHEHEEHTSRKAGKRKCERKRINVCVACYSQGISAEEALRNTLDQMEEH